MNRMISPCESVTSFRNAFSRSSNSPRNFAPATIDADVHRDDPLFLQRFRHVAADDAARETFHDRRLADARLADQHRIVFRPAREHLHDAPDFVVAADDRIDLSAPRQLGQIAPIFLQRLIFPFRILIGHALRTAHLLQAPASACRA